MPDTENTEDNTTTQSTVQANPTHVINVEPNRQLPEMTHSNAPRQSSVTTVSLGRFDLQTPRTLRNSTSLAENISSTIEGFRPFVERVRSHPRLTSWLNIQRRHGATPNAHNSNENYIIYVDETVPNSSVIGPRTTHDERHCQLHNRRSIDSFNNEASVNDNMGNTSNDSVSVRVDNEGNNEENTNHPSTTDGTANNTNASATVPTSGAGVVTPAEGDGNNNTNNSEESSIAENVSISEELTLSPEMRAIMLVLKRYVPYVLILLVKIIYDHIEGITNLLLFLVTFIRVNNDLKREIAKQQNKSWLTLLRILCQIAACFFLVSFVFGEQILVFYAEPVTMLDLLWSVAIMDFSLKLITVALKVLVTCLPTGLLAISKRGKYYLMVEATSQMYRCGAPIKLWITYLFEAYHGPEKIFGIVLGIIYMVSKTGDVISRVSLFRTAACKLLQNMSLGVAPSKEQLVASGGVCAICHEEYTTPVRLSCKHIFCESCVSTWLDRERSCPLCRAAITDDPIYRDGHTTHFIQLY